MVWAITNNKSLFPFFAQGLYNLTVVAELDEGMQCMEDILVLYELDAENVAIRERLHMRVGKFWVNDP